MILIRYSFATLVLCLVVTPLAAGKKARTVHLTDLRTETIDIAPGRTTILNFPTRPAKVILGNRGLFSVEYIENDLAISASSPGSHSNLFVYLEGRRFGFDLRAVSSGGDEIVLVRDAIEERIKVPIKHE